MSNALGIIIEDDDALSDIYEEALRSVGFEPEVIANGRIALNRLKEIVPDLILLDLHLPEVNGQAVLQYIKNETRFNKTIVVITTADPILAEKMRGEADFVLLKPIGFLQLRDLATRLLAADA